MPQLTAERRTQIEAALQVIENVSRTIARYTEEKANLTNRLFINKKQEKIEQLGWELREKSAAFESEYGCAPSEWSFPDEVESEDDSSDEDEDEDEVENVDEDERGVSVTVTPPTSPEKSTTPEANTGKSDFQIWEEEKERREAEAAEQALEAEITEALFNPEKDEEMADVSGDDESTDLFGEPVGDAEEVESDEDEEPRIFPKPIENSPKPIEKQPAVARSQPLTPPKKSVSRETQQPARCGGVVLGEQPARRGGIVLPAKHTPSRTSPVSSVSRPSSASSARSTTIPRGLVLPTGIPTPPSSSPSTRPVSRVQPESTTAEQTLEEQHRQAIKTGVKPAKKAKKDKKRKRSTEDASSSLAPAPKKKRPTRAKLTFGPAKVLRAEDRPRQPTEHEDGHLIICRGGSIPPVPRRLLLKSGAFRDAFETGGLRIGAHAISLDFMNEDGTIHLPDSICPNQFATFIEFAHRGDYDLADLVSEEQLVALNSFERMKAHADLMRLAVDLGCNKFRGAIFRNAQADNLRYVAYEKGLVIDVEGDMSAGMAEKEEVLRLYLEIRSATPAPMRAYNWLGDADAATSFDQTIRNYRYRTFVPV